MKQPHNKHTSILHIHTYNEYIKQRQQQQLHHRREVILFHSEGERECERQMRPKLFEFISTPQTLGPANCTQHLVLVLLCVASCPISNSFENSVSMSTHSFNPQNTDKLFIHDYNTTIVDVCFSLCSLPITLCRALKLSPRTNCRTGRT